MKTKQKDHIIYQEGDWFAVPLRPEGYAVCLVARGEYQRNIALGYFWGPKLAETSTEFEREQYRPEDAIVISWFGDIGIISGRWPLLARSNNFKKALWPVPIFVRIDSMNAGHGWLIEYEQTNPKFGVYDHKTYRSIHEFNHLPKERLAGFESMETKLSQILSVKS